MSIKKDYISPDFEVTNINLISDCLSASQNTYDTGDDFWDLI